MILFPAYQAADILSHDLKLKFRGRDRERSKRVSKYIDSIEGISINQSKNIVIENTYCKHMISVFKEYFAQYNGKPPSIYSFIFCAITIYCFALSMLVLFR